MRPDAGGGRHRRRRPWADRRRSLASLADRWGAWAPLAVLWGWITYRVAVLELPELVVISTAVAAALAATAGYVAGRSDTDHSV